MKRGPAVLDVLPLCLPSVRSAARRAACVAAVCAAIVFASRAGAAPEFVGAARCGACHEAEYQDWQQSGHALAFARLSRVQQKDATCRACHTMVPASDDVLLSGVQCESCHGSGGMYAPRYVMKDKELSKLLGLQPVTDETCASCHPKDTPSVRPFVFAEKLKLVNHQSSKSPMPGEKSKR